MKQINLGKSSQNIPAIAVGCMRIGDMSTESAAELIQTALDEGVNYFDHADIYGGGACEEVFGQAVRALNVKREDLFIQSKCAIIPGVMYDFSKEHILKSADESLKRLGTDYLDALLLHRPDALMEPEEVAEAFDALEKSGKVRHFGVSNHTPLQMELLKKCVRQPLCVNQMQFGLAHTGMVQSGIEANMTTPGASDRDGGVLDYCRLQDITIQTWAPFQYGVFEGLFPGNEKYEKLNQKLAGLEEKYQVSSTTLAVAWILRHPANMQVLAGTTKPERLREICRAAEVQLTREDWYGLYMAAGNILP
ncbi:MAG: aldo/keto reductase [Hespellia sp.]|nr:aldo/keto reductase [Hespellia sp.]